MEGTQPVISVVLLGATGTAIVGLVRLVGAIITLGRAASVTAGQVLAQAAAQRAVGGAQMMLPGMGPAAATGGSWVARTLALLRGPVLVAGITTIVGAVVSALLVGAGIGTLIDQLLIKKMWDKPQDRDLAKAVSTRQNFMDDQARKKLLEFAGLGGDTEGAEKYVGQWIRNKKDQLMLDAERQGQQLDEGSAYARAANFIRTLAPDLQVLAEQASGRAQLVLDPAERAKAGAVAEAQLQQVKQLQEIIDQQTQMVSASNRQARAQEESAQRQEDQMLRWLIYGDQSAIFRQDLQPGGRGVRNY